MSVADRYHNCLATRGWQADLAQTKVIDALDRLIEQISHKRSLPEKLRDLLTQRKPDTPKGLYLWGGVGRGKTFLMDLFFEEVSDVPKMRRHFHRFMKDVHDRLRHLKNVEDPLDEVARQLRSQAQLICFDEFFVADIADAMILGRLFVKLFERGTVLVATSNVAPDLLYKDGLQRSQFLPAIATLKQHTHVLHVDGSEDYRLRSLSEMNMYHHPHTSQVHDLLDTYFDTIAPDAGTRGQPMKIEGRMVKTIRRADGLVWFEFDAICDGPRGAADYIEIAQTFQTVIISDIPQLTTELENQSRRFITLVDEFYDRRVNLIVSAAVDLSLLYTGTKLQFEFQRTRSRIIEMQGAAYLAEPHIPGTHTGTG